MGLVVQLPVNDRTAATTQPGHVQPTMSASPAFLRPPLSIDSVVYSAYTHMSHHDAGVRIQCRRLYRSHRYFLFCHKWGTAIADLSQGCARKLPKLSKALAGLRRSTNRSLLRLKAFRTLLLVSLLLSRPKAISST
jgi:hypothetical protein